MVALAVFLAFATAASATYITPNPLLKLVCKPFAPEDIITRDVVIIGGGASGSYAAVRLREDYKRSVVIVEKNNRLGGHTETYHDPETNMPYDFGVYSYLEAGPAKALFARLKVATGSLSRPSPPETRYADFKTGRAVTGYEPTEFSTVVETLVRYADLCDKYTDMLIPGYWNFPTDVPEELLIPFREFIRRHRLEDMVSQSFYVTGLGLGDMLDEPTMHVMQTFGAPLARAFTGGTLTFGPVSRNNSELYHKMADLLGEEDILYSTTVDRTLARRKSGIELVVRDGEGKSRLIRAKRILFTAAPTTENLRPFVMDDVERTIFSKWEYTREYVGVIRHPSLSRNVSVVNTHPDAPTNKLAIPTVPIVKFDSAGNNTDLQLLTVVDSAKSTLKTAMQATRDSVRSLIASGVIPDTGGDHDVEFLAVAEHGPMHLRVGADLVRDGFMKKLYALQGRRGTFFAGAAWSSHFSSMVWDHVDTILPFVARDLERMKKG